MSTAIVGVQWETDKGIITGYAFNSTGRYSCAATVSERFAPRLLALHPADLIDENGLLAPDKILNACLNGEKPGGDLERSMAIGIIEIACWDCLAKYLGLPLYRLLSSRFNDGNYLDSVPCYVGGGWYKENELEGELEDEVDNYLSNGYEIVKIKVGRDLKSDLNRVNRVLNHLRSGSQLAVDANCGLGEHSESYARAFADFELRWFEEPVHPVAHKKLKSFVDIYSHAVATGENCFSLEEATNLVELGGLRAGIDFLQFDIPQTYGISYLIRLLTSLKLRGWRSESFIPHGGNLMSLSIVAGLQLRMCESYPNVFGVFSGFYDSVKVSEGCIKIQNAPGIGFETQANLMDAFNTLGFGKQS